MRIGDGIPASGARPPVRQVAAQRTPAAMADIRAALTRALESSTGGRPSARTVDVLSAQVSLETAHGGSMYNFNFGGIKGSSPDGETANYLTREVVDGRDIKLQQGFRAYHSLDEGAKDYVSVLKTRFPQAYAQAMAGNVDGFAHALKQSHYFTAPEQEYAAGLRAAAGVSGASSASAATPSAPLAPVPTEASGLATSLELSRVMDAIALSASRIVAPDPTDG